MSTLIGIAALQDPAAAERHRIHSLPVLVVFPHNQCNCRCVMCDIWRIRKVQELTPADFEEQLISIRKLAVRWVVFSGGEPQLNEKWIWLAQTFRSLGSRVTLLTAGLLLKSQARMVIENVNDVIISLDGPPEIHNHIRRVPNAFEQLTQGVRTLHELRPDFPVRARCTIQKANRNSLRAVAQSAKAMGLQSISFLAADLTSTAFNRPEAWHPAQEQRVAVDSDEVDELEAEVEKLIAEYCADIDSGFIVESAEKLRRIVRHFRAHLGQAPDVAPRCNAPWVSAVIEASGDVRPCFFHPVVGNIHRAALEEIVNGEEASRFRTELDVASNPICQKCVCSLYIPDEQKSARGLSSSRGLDTVEIQPTA